MTIKEIQDILLEKKERYEKGAGTTFDRGIVTGLSEALRILELYNPEDKDSDNRS